MARESGVRRPWRLALGVGMLAVPLAAGLYAWRADAAAAAQDPQAAIGQLLAGSEGAEGAAGAEHVYSQLERQLQRYPTDVRARVLKARLDMQAGRFDVAAAGYARALEGTSKAAADPDVWVEYAEATGMMQGRTLVGEPQRLVDKALALDANHPGALDLAGSAAWETRDFGAAAGHWKRLLAQLPKGSPRHAELGAAIERAEQRAKLSLPAAR
jgi:cytochrome c-type biogenesis protein CcmH